MVWPFGSSGSGKDTRRDEPPARPPISWAEMIANPEEPAAAIKEWAPMVFFSIASLGALQLYANYLRRIPGAAFVRPAFFRNRSIFGRVTSVGDGDNFHLFHTPGGRSVGWGWLRKVPDKKKELRGRTVCSHHCPSPLLLLPGLALTTLLFSPSKRSPSESPVSTPPRALTLVDQPSPSQLRRSNG